MLIRRVHALKRKKRRKERREERLERKNLFGAADLTPFNAVQVMSGKEIKYR
jgi:hypothetical protein